VEGAWRYSFGAVLGDEDRKEGAGVVVLRSLDWFSGGSGVSISGLILPAYPNFPVRPSYLAPLRNLRPVSCHVSVLFATQQTPIDTSHLPPRNRQHYLCCTLRDIRRQSYLPPYPQRRIPPATPSVPPLRSAAAYTSSDLSPRL
jgi:hypothetical protein